MNTLLTSLLTPAKGARRLTLPEYLALCKAHIHRYWKHYTIPLLVVFLLQLVVRIDVNYTESLPDHVFITVKGWKSELKRGDYVAYHFPSESSVSPFRKGDHMVKIIGGVAGDEVRMDAQRNFTIVSPDASTALVSVVGGSSMGTAKSYSRAGKLLEPGPVGVIPEGAYYVFAPHKDSLDSRYAIVGWVKTDDLIGRTFSLF